MKYISITFILLASFSFLHTNAQSDKEVIIIEKTVDEQGNVISKQTRRLNGNYDDREIQELLEDEPSMGMFDLEGLGFGENVFDIFRSEPERPTIGVNLSFEKGAAEVVSVIEGSGADEADIREGDRIISVNDIPISTIEDIQQILDDKSANDKVKLKFFRDGEEIERDIELKGRRNSSFFFDLPRDGSLQFFGDGSDDFPFELDSLIEMFDFDNLPQQFEQFRNLAPRGAERRLNDKTLDNRASLGVFIDDIGAGVLISEVIKDSPADKAGLKEGDVIIGMDDITISEYADVTDHMDAKKIGDTMELKIERNGRMQNISVVLD